MHAFQFDQRPTSDHLVEDGKDELTQQYIMLWTETTVCLEWQLGRVWLSSMSSTKFLTNN